MSATDELRSLLDEHNIDWKKQSSSEPFRTLTAEQLRKAAESNSRRYESPFDDGVWVTEYDWQAIVDELNAMKSAGAIDWICGFADDIASNRDSASKEVRDARYKELALLAYWAGSVDAAQMNKRDCADDIEYGSAEHINGLSRFELEAEFRWLLGRCRELEAECVRLSETQAEREKCHNADTHKGYFACSGCGYTFNSWWFGYSGDNPDFRYCPNCGREVEQ